MNWRFEHLILRGELFNSRRNSVHGWFEFADERGIRVDLTGNMQGELAGKRVHFETRRPPDSDNLEVADAPDDWEDRQIGVVGTMKVERDSANDGNPTTLRLEWFGQNGRVTVTLVDPILTITDEASESTDSDTNPPHMDDATPPADFQFDPNAHEVTEELFEEDDDEEDDPFHLFPPDLESRIEASAESQGAAGHSPDESPAVGRRPWDEVIPGIDDETKAMYEQWDEIFDGDKDEPLATIFDPPLILPPPDRIAGDAEATDCLRRLLARLAEHCVAVDMCEHASALDTYRWLVEEILPQATIYPALAGTGFVQHYSTWETCPHCEADFDAEYIEEFGDEDDGDENCDDDFPF